MTGLFGIALRITAARFGVLFVALVVAAGAALPAVARVVAGPAVHVCHCATSGGGHATCACPICFPELREDEPPPNPTVTGTCGDDEQTGAPYILRHATPIDRVSLLPAPSARTAVPEPPDAPREAPRAPPETPPPEGTTTSPA